MAEEIMLDTAPEDALLLHSSRLKFEQAARSRQLQELDETVSRARLECLKTLAAELSSPLPLARIAAVVGAAALKLLDAEIVVVAARVDDPRQLRSVHIAGIPQDCHDRLCAAPYDEASLIAEIDRLRADYGAARAGGPLAVLPIEQVACARGVLLVGRMEDRPFSEGERSFGRVLAGLCGLALDRLRLSAQRARARRRNHGPEASGTHIRVGDLDIDLVGHNVSFDGRAAGLTTSELRLLAFLAEHPGRARSRHEILSHLWNTDHVGDERACDVHISNLRRKIEREPSRPERLVTLRGYGYALVPRYSSSGPAGSSGGASCDRRPPR
jgi:DNA-binding winged helix-turn-helix (wHTH) protein